MPELPVGALRAKGYRDHRRGILEWRAGALTGTAWAVDEAEALVELRETVGGTHLGLPTGLATLDAAAPLELVAATLVAVFDRLALLEGVPVSRLPAGAIP